MLKKLLNNSFLWVVIIFVTAVVFRVFSLDLIEFKYDEAYTVFQMEQFFAQPYLMQVGPPQSTGVYNPPLFNYLMTVLSLFSRHPQYLGFLIALINSIFVAIFYLVVRKFYGNFTGIVAGLLLATSPWSIIFSRKIWIPDLLGPMMVIVFYYLHKLIVSKNTGAVLPLFVFLALIPQMHASGLFFTFTTFIIFLVLKVKVNFKKALTGFGIGLTPAIPYFVRQLTSDPFCIDCVSFLSYQSGVRSYDLYNFTSVFNFLGGFNFQILLGENYAEFLLKLPFSGLLPLLYIFNIIAILMGVVWIIKSQRHYLFLVLYLLILPALYFLTKTPAYMHYFVVLSLVVILLQALFFRFLWEVKADKVIKGLILGLLTLTLLFNVIFETSFYRFLSEKKVIKGDYGPVYSVTGQYIKEQTNQYQLLPDYDLLKSYSYMFAQTPLLHQKIGDYFVQTGKPTFAVEEFKKALEDSDNDKYSRANLAYLYLQLGKMEESRKEIDVLSAQDSTLSAKLQNLWEQKRP